MVLATCSGVTWAWPRLLASDTDCLMIVAASTERGCWTVKPPDLMVKRVVN